MMDDVTHKITLRPIEVEDLKQMRDWRNSPGVRLICREYRLLNMEDQHAWFEGLRGDVTRLMFGIMAETVNFIGVCGWTHIDWRSRHALLSMYIGDEHWRKDKWYLAVLAELHRIAFDELGMHTVRAEVYDFAPRKDFFDKAHYGVVGKWPQAYFHDGQFRDIILMQRGPSE